MFNCEKNSTKSSRKHILSFSRKITFYQKKVGNLRGFTLRFPWNGRLGILNYLSGTVRKIREISRYLATYKGRVNYFSFIYLFTFFALLFRFISRGEKRMRGNPSDPRKPFCGAFLAVAMRVSLNTDGLRWTLELCPRKVHLQECFYRLQTREFAVPSKKCRN